MAVESQMLCDSFVPNYYKIIHSNPEEVHKFYKDCSALSRPDASGVLTTVSAMHGINEKIMSLNEDERNIDVKSTDAVDSLDGGVIILVTGSVLGLGFAQTFFLARQEIGYFVLTDIFRYIDTGEPSETISGKEELNGNRLKEDHLPPANSAAQAPTVQTKTKPAVNGNQLKEDHLPTANSAAQAPTIQTKPKPAVMKTVAPHSEELIEKSSPKSDSVAHAPASQVETKLAVLEVIPQKSFKAVLMQKPMQLPPKVVPHDKNVAKVASTEANKHSVAKVASTEANKQPTATTASSVVRNTADKTNAAALQSGRGESYSIYLSGLPHNLTASQLEEECRKFGAITPDGVQVKTKADGFTFGFVAFVNESSVQKALKASPILIKDKPAFVQIKRGAPYGAGGNMNPRDGYGAGGESRRDGYCRNESFKGRQNDAYWGGYSDGDYHRGYYSNAGGTAVRQEDRRYRKDGRSGVPPSRDSLR